MKKKIVIISIVLMGFLVALTSNSWAKREKNGHRRGHHGDRIQNVDHSAHHHFRKDRDRDRSSRRDFDRPGHRFKHRDLERHHHRPGHRFKHKHDKWPHYRTGNRFKHRDLKRHHYRPGPRYRYKYYKRHYYRPGPWYKHRYLKRHPYRVPDRFRPGYRPWRDRPVFHDGHPRPFTWWDHFMLAREYDN